VDRMGTLADESGKDFLRLENLDCDIPPDPQAMACSARVRAGIPTTATCRTMLLMSRKAARWTFAE
jgi:hypothetical protein